MSDNEINPILIEVEEAGIEAYVVDHQRMLDGLDNPSEVNRVGDGTCAGDNYVERESNAMGRDGGPMVAKLSPHPRPRIQSLFVLNLGLMGRFL